MRRRLLLCFIFAFVFLATAAYAQVSTGTPPASVQRDPTASSTVAAAIAAFGSTPPTDSVAQATVQLANGDSATLVIRGFGLRSNSEDLVDSNGEQKSIFVDGESNLRQGNAVESRTLERSASSSSCVFLLPELVVALNNPDVALEYVGQEGTTSHVRLRNTFASRPTLSRLAPFTRKDIWFDSATGLPTKIVFEHRQAEGAVPSIAVEVDFSNYRSVSGLQYPFSITKLVNGVPWGTITIQTVQFNTGLTPADFPIQ